MKPTKEKENGIDLSVFGYSSRLFQPDELDDRPENSYLIPWQDDDKLLIDRYDCRVYLQDLSEKIIGTASNIDHDEFGDKFEEELCEEERYKDLKDAELARKKEEASAKRGKGAEIAFSYDNNDAAADDDLSGDSDDENDEAYEPPEGVKMPVGINLPPTVKLGHIIERTANFVALEGNQMEIIIKAKHRDHKERFGFLEFDHPLNSFYKYMCKLIREKKYTPKPPQKRKLLPGEHTVQERPAEHETDEGSDSDDGDYLHPLLMASKRAKMGSPAPIPIPVSSSKSNPYSSLYGSLYSEKNEKQETEEQTKREKTPPPKEEPSRPEPTTPSNVETDALEIHNYQIWHQWFYNRPSIFLPNPPPKLKVPPADIQSQINVAAKFVAANGAFSERNLMEHNRGRLNFLYPNSENLIYYHSKLRFFQSRLNPRVMPCVYSKYHKQFEAEFPVQTIKPAPPPDPKPESKQDRNTASFDQPATSNYIPAAPSPPKPIKTSEFPADDSKSTDQDEEVKRKRKERAQQFMADIIRKKKTDNKKDRPEKNEPKKAKDLVVPADVAVPSLISSLVSGQLEKLKFATKPQEAAKNEESQKERKRRRSRTPKRRSRSRERSRERSRRSRSPRRRHRRRSRSPSYDSSPDRRRRRRRSRSRS